MKQWVEPESMRAVILGKEVGRRGDVSRTQREFGSKRVDVLRWTTSVGALEGTTQSLVSAEAEGLLMLFSNLQRQILSSLFP